MFPMHSFIFCSLIILATASSSTQQFPKFHKESGLGIVDYCAVTEAVKSCSKKINQKESHTHWSNKERFTTAKYAAENRHAATAQKLLSMEKLLNESAVRRFCKRYKDELQKFIPGETGNEKGTIIAAKG